MRLSVTDRILLQHVLPGEGNIITLRIVMDLRRELGFSEEEIKALELKEEGGNVRWNSEKELTKDVEIGPRAYLLIGERLRTLSDEEKLRPEHIPLYERFVEENTDA